MERLTKRIREYVYYTQGKYAETIPFEMETEDVRKVMHKLAEYEDAEEQGLLLRLDSKDKLIEVLATKLLHSEFGYCYMCTNPMKNITLDGVNNGCDGCCNTSEEFTVDDFLKKIVEEMQRKEEAEQKLASMQKGE